MSKDNLPFNLEAEKAVIGCILIDNDNIMKVVDKIKPDHFYDPRNFQIYDTIIMLHSGGKAVDLLTLNTELAKKGKKGTEPAYISDIIDSVPAVSNVEEYTMIVRENAIRRFLMRLGGDMESKSRNFDNEVERVIDEVEKDLFNISENSTTSDLYNAATLLEMQMKRADEYAKNPNAMRGIPTGISTLDHILNGLHNSDLIILAARPSVGKSAFAIDISRHIGVHEKKTVCIFSLEMPAIQVMDRILAQQTGISMWNIKTGTMTKDDYKKYSVGIGKISESKLFIDETPGLSAMQLRSKARKVKMQHGLDLIIVDYLQLMQGSGRTGDNRALEIAEISRSLKILARELNIPIVALSQLNRAVENRPDKTPQLSDLRESGSIEQDADLVMFLGRDINEELSEEKSSDYGETFSKVDVIIAKHRNGPVGKIKLRFDGAKQKFYDLVD